MNTYLTPDGQEYISNNEVYPSDNGEFVHVLAYPKHLHKEDLYRLTFKSNPDYNGYIDDPADWSDWVILSAEYVGDYDAIIKEEDERLLILNTGETIDKNMWNGEKWFDNGKEYRPLYSYNYETGDSVIIGIEIK